MDGTLVNTYPGIYNSYQYAFQKMNLSFPGEKFVGKAIGAPLLSVFRETCGLTEEQAAEAVKFYREYYASKGKSEADVYDGISENLKALKENHILLGVATSETILVGDSEYDADGAAQASVDFLAVLYGFGFKDPDVVRTLDKTAHTAYEMADMIMKN